MGVDHDLQGLLDMTNATPAMSSMTPSEAREAFRMSCVLLRPPESITPVAAVTEGEVAGGAGQLPARVYRSTEEPRPTLVFFHGGGWVIGDLDTHDAFCRALCVQADVCVVSVEYRLAPENPFPAAVEDALAATHDVLARRAEFGGGDQLAVGGDSAGGNLSAVVCQQIPGIAAQFLIYPVVHPGAVFPSYEENAEGYFLSVSTMAWMIDHYAPEMPQDPSLAPILGTLEGLPPAVIVTAGFDPLRDEGIAYADALASAGVRVDHRHYPEMVHGFIDFDWRSPGAKSARDEAIAAFAEVLKGA